MCQEESWVSRNVALDPVNHLAEVIILVLVDALQDVFLSYEIDKRHVTKELQDDAKVSRDQNVLPIVLPIGAKDGHHDIPNKLDASVFFVYVQ